MMLKHQLLAIILLYYTPKQQIKLRLSLLAILLGGCLARTPPPKILSVLRDAAGRKKKQKKRKTIKIRGLAIKRLASMEHANFTMKKKNYKRRLHPQPLYTQFSLSRNSSLKSSFSLGRPPKSLK